MKSTYAGDSPAKKVSRAALHATSLFALRSLRKQASGFSLILAGYDGAEVDVTHAAQGVPHKSIIAIDLDPAAVARCHVRFPEAISICSPLENINQLIRKNQHLRFSFIHIDLCGHLNAAIYQALVDLAPRVLEGGVVAVTYARGHETQMTLINNSQYKHELSDLNIGARRLLATEQLIKDALSPNAVRAAGIYPIFYDEYVGHKIPMSTIAFQYAPTSLRTTEWASVVQKTRKRYYTRRVNTAELTRIVTVAALDPLDLNDGLSNTDRIARIYNLPRSTVSAWLAHQTRGTYAKVDEAKK